MSQHRKRPRDDEAEQPRDIKAKTAPDHPAPKVEKFEKFELDVTLLTLLRTENHHTTDQQTTDIIRRLLDRKANPHAAMGQNDSALALAIVNQHWEGIKLLLEAKANPERHTGAHSPLTLAAWHDRQVAIYLLLKAGVNTEEANDQYPDYEDRLRSPLLIKKMLAWGTHKKQGKETPPEVQKEILSELLVSAVEHRRINDVRILLEEKADCDSAKKEELYGSAEPDLLHITPVLISALQPPANLPILRLLLDAKADVNKPYQTPKMVGSEEVAGTVTYSSVGVMKSPPIFFASNIDALELLLERKADINATSLNSHDTDSLLITKLRHKADNYQLINTLLDKKADVNGPCICSTALISAIYRFSGTAGDPIIGEPAHIALVLPRHIPLAQNPEKRNLIKRIIELKGDVNRGTPDQHYTPLMYAAALEDVELVQLLLENQAAAAVGHPHNGETALDFAKKAGAADIVALLERHIKMQQRKEAKAATPSAALLSQLSVLNSHPQEDQTSQPVAQQEASASSLEGSISGPTQ